MISYQHKCIFIHIPKSGGSSIESIIWPESDRIPSNLYMGFIDAYHNKYQTGGLQHLLAKQILHEVGYDVFSNSYKFTIIRNPWDKAVSQYAYMQKRKDLMQFIGMSEHDSFKKYLSLIQKKTHVQWEEQNKFIFNDNGECLVDYIGRFEKLDDEIRHVLKEIYRRTPSIDPDINTIPHLEKSTRSHYEEYYDAESKEIVAQIYKRDIEYFSYSF